MLPTRPTPGVYLQEIDGFPSSVVPAATAVPAFIGYTARASYHGRSCAGVPVRLGNLAEFMACFGVLDAAGQPAPEAAQYAPVYYPVRAASPLTPDLMLGGQAYDLEPDPTTVYSLYNSVRLFYANGGGACYVVSVGGYGPARGRPKAKADPLVNPNLALASLTAALDALRKENEPTMIVVPEATLLSPADNQTLSQAVLAHCREMQSRVGILDVPGGAEPDPQGWPADIQKFRTSVGLSGLAYGVSYYPFLKAAIASDGAIDFRNLGGREALAAVLPAADVDPLRTLLAAMDQPASPAGLTAGQIEAGLLETSTDYQKLHDALLAKINTLPPSGAMAGVYAQVDDREGVWHAPANLALAAVTDVTLKLSDGAQADLGADAATGKSINAIRLFSDQGVLVRGAQTLDGNNNENRYVNFRRTLIMINQTAKGVLHHYVAAPNNATTWSLVTSLLDTFLTDLWRQGALLGATAASAFTVEIGLGTTMTAEDVLNGTMIVSIRAVLLRPGEFVAITITQQQQMPAIQDLLQ